MRYESKHIITTGKKANPNDPKWCDDPHSTVIAVSQRAHRAERALVELRRQGLSRAQLWRRDSVSNSYIPIEVPNV